MDNEERKRIWQQFMEKGTLDPLLPPLVAQSWQECRRRGVDDMTQEEYRKAAVDAVKKLAKDVGIPENLKDIVKKDDIPFLAQSAYDDACRPGNPKETSVADITELYESLI